MTAPGVTAPVDPAADYRSRPWSERFQLRRDAGMGRQRSRPTNAAILHWLGRRMARRDVFVTPLILGPLFALAQLWGSARGSYLGVAQAVVLGPWYLFLSYRRLRRAAVANGRVLGLGENDAVNGMPGLAAYVAAAMFIMACGVGALLRWPVQSP